MKNTHRGTHARVAAIAITTIAALVIGVQGAVAADPAVVTHGEFRAFATSSDPDIIGQATMVRTADGKTIVTVSVRGLAPSTSYGAHVHARACADGFAGSHYKHDPAGPAAPPNEIWPAFTTNEAGVGNGRATAAWLVRPEATSVVVHAPGGAKIACADLG
jgi:hypothetical protein